MRFIIIIPQGRYRRSAEMAGKIQSYMHDLQSSLTDVETGAGYPTAVFSADGSELFSGKTAVLNWAIQSLRPETWDVWCTFDDDIWLPPNWQHKIARAFAMFPEYVGFGCDWSATQEGKNYMMEVNPTITRDDVTIRPLNQQNIAGAMVCMRGDVVAKVGVNPNNAHIKYDWTEDGWRCGQYRRHGKLGYVVFDGEQPRLLSYPDTHEYNQQIVNDCAANKNPIVHPRKALL